MKLPKSFITVTPFSKVFALILFITLPFIGFYFGKKYNQPILPSNNCSIEKPTPSTPPEDNTELITDQAPFYVDKIEQNKPGYGIIEGSLSYPSDFVPDQVVCAENTTSGEVYCTKKNITDKKFTNGKGYRLQVPEGFYTVYVQFSGKKIYYDDLVICGLYNGCPSHSPIVIRVNSLETRTQIDPSDWYN